MINFLKRAKDKATVARELFFKYLEATRDFTVAAERCSIRVSPGQEVALKRTFGLQLLFNSRDGLRFEYLLRGDAPDILNMKSLYAMSDRVRQDWKEAEEAGLRKNSAIYVDVLRQIEHLQGNLDSAELEGPLNAVKADLGYREARRVIAEKIQEIHKQLGNL